MSARVLVVDDLEPNVKLLEAKLRAEYFDVIGVFSGPDAIARATGLEPEQPERLKARLGEAERLTVLPNDAKTVASFIADRARARTEVGA